MGKNAAATTSHGSNDIAKKANQDMNELALLWQLDSLTLVLTLDILESATRGKGREVEYRPRSQHG